jgi:hypothetical protein
MELETRQFGRLTYETHEVIQLLGVDADDKVSSSWLLLADKHHPHLFWLQSTTNADWAIPVCSLSGTSRTASLNLFPRQDAKSALRTRTTGTYIALAEIREEQGEVFLNLERPILIDPHSHRGIRLLADDDQALQYAPSAKVAPLRKCA